MAELKIGDVVELHKKCSCSRAVWSNEIIDIGKIVQLSHLSVDIIFLQPKRSKYISRLKYQCVTIAKHASLLEVLFV